MHPRVVVPKSEGRALPRSIAVSAKMLARIDAIAKETKNTRAVTVRHLLRFAMTARASNISLAV